MVATNPRARTGRLLAAGAAAGVLLALLARLDGESGPIFATLVAALPFLLAMLTGVAKTTTA